MPCRTLAAATLLLAAILAINSILGPFLLDVIDYGFSETIRNQGIGLDAVSLIVVAPLAAVAAWLLERGRALGPVLALAIGGYSAYMGVQYLVGPNYTVAAHAWPFHLAFFIIAVMVAVGGWSAATRASWPAGGEVHPRLLATVLIGVAGFVVLRYLPILVGAAGEDDLPEEYAADPAFFWTIALMDLGVFVPAAVATAVGMVSGERWAAPAANAIVAWFTLVTLAVTGMAVAMNANDDPYASNGQLVLFGLLSVLTVVFAAWLFRPLLRASDDLA